MPDSGRLQPRNAKLLWRRVLALSMAAVGIAAMTILGIVVFRSLIASLKDPRSSKPGWISKGLSARSPLSASWPCR